MEFRKDKFKGLVHYICWKSTDPSRLGAVKLNKILWFSDIIAFATLGESITGAPYIKRRSGPVPKPILPALRELVNENRVRIEEVEYFGRPKKQYISLCEPDRSIFTDEQLRIIDDALKSIAEHHTASSISNLTHDDIWKLVEDGEEIPYFAVFAS